MTSPHGQLMDHPPARCCTLDKPYPGFPSWYCRPTTLREEPSKFNRQPPLLSVTYHRNLRIARKQRTTSLLSWRWLSSWVTMHNSKSPCYHSHSNVNSFLSSPPMIMAEILRNSHPTGYYDRWMKTSEYFKLCVSCRTAVENEPSET